MERFTKNDALDRAEHLREFLEFSCDSDVLVAADGEMCVKYMDAQGYAPDLYVSGSTWTDLYNSLCAIEDAIEFAATCGKDY